jgi:molybdopterin-guanine dinucleotide biosynthesis protein MobB
MTNRELIPAVSFTGRQNSGKTTLLEALIREACARGLRVGTIKHHSHAGFDMDIEGKDSWRHAQAGSRYTVVAAPDKLGSMRLLSGEVSAEDIVCEMSANARDANGAPTLDLILIEGYRASSLPSVDLFRAANPKDADRLLDVNDGYIVAVVTDIPRVRVEAADAGIPAFAFTDSSAIVDFLQDFLPEFV